MNIPDILKLYDCELTNEQKLALELHAAKQTIKELEDKLNESQPYNQNQDIHTSLLAGNECREKSDTSSRSTEVIDNRPTNRQSTPTGGKQPSTEFSNFFTERNIDTPRHTEREEISDSGTRRSVDDIREEFARKRQEVSDKFDKISEGMGRISERIERDREDSARNAEQRRDTFDEIRARTRKIREIDQRIGENVVSIVRTLVSECGHDQSNITLHDTNYVDVTATTIDSSQLPSGDNDTGRSVDRNQESDAVVQVKVKTKKGKKKGKKKGFGK